MTANFPDFLPLKQTKPKSDGLIEIHSIYHSKLSDIEARRSIAVDCALKLIYADLLSSDSASVTNHMSNLGKYVTAIENALQVEEKETD